VPAGSSTFILAGADLEVALEPNAVDATMDFAMRAPSVSWTSS
jgi:hypothetical protein